MLRFALPLVAASALSLLTFSSAAEGQKAPSWTGFNVSVGGGISNLDTDLDIDAAHYDKLGLLYYWSKPLLLVVGKAFGHADHGDNEWQGFGTIQGGYDHQIGHFVVGGFASFDFYPGDNEISGSDGIDGGIWKGLPPFYALHGFEIADFANISSSIELRNTWSIGGRLGFLVTPNILLYGVGGYTEAKVDGTVDFTYLSLLYGPETLSLKLPSEMRGYFIGGGGEVKIDSNLALRFEYRYADYGAISGSAFSKNLDFCYPLYGYEQQAGIHANLDTTVHSVRGAIVLQLGTP